MKRVILRNSRFPGAQVRFGSAQLKQILIEPFLVVAACLAWVTILPITGVFCAGIGAYHKMTSPHWA